MIVLGVIRIRAAHQHQQHRQSSSRLRSGDDQDQEIAWDDSSLTITVNPMDGLSFTSTRLGSGLRTASASTSTGLSHPAQPALPAQHRCPSHPLPVHLP
ncbi:hypothetical protein V5799_025102 [Amblyomma americanum]|uniref:Calsyntenin C-terminal domain-containing protein n=1 Tax=Amblyomma americanum TaxID=6943 RepID=A0AAQ4EAA2_AMBAM